MTNWTDPQVYAKADIAAEHHPLYRQGWADALRLNKLTMSDIALRDELHALRGFKEGVESMAPRLHEEVAYQKQNAEQYAKRCAEYEEMLRYVKLKLKTLYSTLMPYPVNAVIKEIDAALEKPWS